jgi:hypothetical protein
VQSGRTAGPQLIRWTYTYTGEEFARAWITASTAKADESWFRIKLGDCEQTIVLVPQPRHFGGYQWYFTCPVMSRLISVLWKPPGARQFCSRQTWGNRVAYASQFQTPVDRAHSGQAKIKKRLIADLDPDDWDLPPKPKWMRWTTYNRHVASYDRYEDVLDVQTLRVARCLLSRG